jgi:hypothetical protein
MPAHSSFEIARFPAYQWASGGGKLSRDYNSPTKRPSAIAKSAAAKLAIRIRVQ